MKNNEKLVIKGKAYCDDMRMAKDLK